VSDDRARIDELLDRAVAAINRGDRVSATALAGQVLADDQGNAEAADLLVAPDSHGEIRRLTILFADLVDSTVLSTRVEPETYRLLVGRYRDLVLGAVEHYEGHVESTKGDGLLAMFGHPIAHENDARRAVLAGVEITREVAKLCAQAERRFGIGIDVRVGIHRGLVYLDTTQDDVYGLAANLAARVSGLAAPGTVVISDAVAPLVRDAFELEPRPAAAVKGVDGLIAYHRVLGEQARAARMWPGPLVGRGGELARLTMAWERARAGALSVPAMVLRGEPGIGKSRLASVVAEHVERSGGEVLELAGSPFHTDVGLYPLRVLLEHRCGIGRHTDAAERLRRLEVELRSRALNPTGMLPLLAPVMSIGAEAGYEPVAAEGDKLYELIGEAVKGYLLVCMGGAGLLVAEDLHWFDPSTIEVLGGMIDQADGRLLVVVTSRDGKRLPDGWPVEVIELAPLTDEQADELIVALDPGASAQERAAVRGRCDGVPFFIEQVMNGLTAADSGTVVPEVLYEPLFARLRARADVVPVVEAAAVIGRDVDRALLSSVCDLGDEQIDDAIDELVDALVLEPSGFQGWRFRHELLREVANEMAPPSVRRALHARVADTLVTGVGDPDWRLVATHYEQAGLYARAASAYREASTAACQRGALTEARTHLTSALSGLEREPPGADRDHMEMSLRLRRGSLTAAAVGRGAYLEDFERCLQLGGTDLRDDELFTTLLAVLGYYNIRADMRRCLEVLELLRAGVGEGREWFRDVVDANFAIVAWLRGEFDAAGSGLEAATASMGGADHHRVDALRPSDTLAAAQLHLALTHMVRGDLAAAEAQLARSARRAERLGFPQRQFTTGHALFVEAWIRTEAGQLERAAELVDEIVDLSERHGLDTSRLNGMTQQSTLRALTTLYANDIDRTALTAQIDALAGHLDNWRTRGVNLYRTYFDGVLGRLLTAAGRPDEARRHLNTALRLADSTGMHFYDTELLRHRAHTETDSDARQADLAAALGLARRQCAPLFELRAALDDFELRGEPARAALVDVIGRLPANSAFPEFARAVALTAPATSI